MVSKYDVIHKKKHTHILHTHVGDLRANYEKKTAREQLKVKICSTKERCIFAYICNKMFNTLLNQFNFFLAWISSSSITQASSHSLFVNAAWPPSGPIRYFREVFFKPFVGNGCSFIHWSPFIKFGWFIDFFDDTSTMQYVCRYVCL